MLLGTLGKIILSDGVGGHGYLGNVGWMGFIVPSKGNPKPYYTDSNEESRILCGSVYLLLGVGETDSAKAAT